jgi:CheY-like chemotaxis protein
LSLNAALLGGGRAVLWLSLPGVELPAEAQERFFEPFAGPKEGPDPPLGIAGWLRPWEDLGGTIGLEMLPAGVVSLTLTCPAIEEGEATQPAAPAGPLVLLVEDEESIRQLVERSLGREGYRVVTAGSAEAALALPEAAKCDLLVTDVSLAGMGGRGLAERMRAGRGALPVLFISGATNDEELDRQLREGRLPAGTVFLQKPFPVGSLLEAVGKLVGRR